MSGAPGFTLWWSLGSSRTAAAPGSGPPAGAGDERLTYRSPHFWLDATLPAWSSLRYTVPGGDGSPGSFVLLFGAACWRDRQDAWLSAGDLAAFLERHRAGQPLPVLEVDGNYTAISYDHVSGSVWVATDFWATAGFYYGSGADFAVVSSRAAVVANLLGSPVGASGYLSLLRSTVPPAGTTLFRDVARIGMGQALRLDRATGGVKPTRLGPLYHDPDAGSFADSVDRSMGALRRVVPFSGSRAGTVMDVTAGNDTRLLAAALADRADVTRSMAFRVVGPPTSPDVVISARLAQRLGWAHRACAQQTGALTADALAATARSADGAFSLELIANRLAFEERQWPDARHLIGGLAGELFRSWIWQPELLRMGRTPSINYEALLRHRVPRDHRADVMRITGGRLDARAHDEMLMAPLRALDASLPSVLNVYKLDLYYIQRLMHRVPWWAIAPHVVTILPFLWMEITDVALRIPWRHKMTRRLVTTAVERLDPGMAKEPTDRGAPFQPLRAGSAVAYGRYLSGYVSDIVKRHYLSRTPRPLLAGTRPPAVPPEWADRLVGPKATLLHDGKDVIERVRGGGADLGATARQEFLTMLQVQLLFEEYPGIRRELAFS